MQRRLFLANVAAFAFAPNFNTDHFGWIPPTEDKGGRFYDISGLDNFGKDKQAFLCNAYKKVTKRNWPTRKQFRGDCASVGATTALDFVTVTQTLQRKTSWQGNHSIVAHYVGGKKLAGQNPMKEGARTEWLIKFFEEYGVLLAKKYGEDDIRQWNWDTYRAYKDGLSDNLKIKARLHPLIHRERIKSYNEARDAIAAGFPVILASKMGVSGAKKDKDGFFYPKGYDPHCMCCIGVDDKDRPSILIQNSHGPNWAPGPKRYGFEPEGSAWLDAEHFDFHVDRYNDSWTISMFRGYKVKRKYILW